MISTRLEKKIKNACHKNILPLVLLDWLLNGTVKDKIDAYGIVDNLNDAVKLLNGIYGQINQTVSDSKVKDDLYASLKKILTQEDKYGKIDTKNRVYIEVRGWLIPIFAKCCCNEKNKKDCLKILDNFMNETTDNLTLFWSFTSYIYYVNILTKEEIKAKVDILLQRENNSDIKTSIYWTCAIWYLNNEDNDYSDNKYIKEIDTLLNSDEDCIIDFFVSLSNKACPKIIKLLSTYISKIIEKDLDFFWEEKDIHLYKYLIMSITNYGYKHYKNKIANEQINLYYDLFKLLNISRNYSSRIWNEIKQQIMKGLRIYYKTTERRIIDELKEELLCDDITIVCASCKTLNSIYGMEDSLKIIINTLYNEYMSNQTFDSEKILSVAYSLKILSLKKVDLIERLDELSNNIQDYEKSNIIRMIFTEMGGFSAIKKSKENQSMKDKYMQLTSDAQIKVENLFHSSIKDAKKAFKYSLYMNLSVFFLGLLLLAVSGFSAIFNDNEDNWAGVGISSGTGFLSIVYSLFINKPSRKIRKNTNHLMRLKVIFLGYLRELTQMDQSFSKKLLDCDIISQNELNGFINKISYSMNNALKSLRWEETLNQKGFVYNNCENEYMNYTSDLEKNTIINENSSTDNNDSVDENMFNNKKKTKILDD